jgi:hypothetical protein
MTFTQTGQTRTTAKVTLEGPFFRKDPGKTFRGNVRDMMDNLAVEMEREVRRQTDAHAGQMPNWTGWSADHVHGFTEWNIDWGTWAAVQAYTKGMSVKDAKRTKAAAATIERRWHPYRSVKSGIYRSRALITADLAKGLE